MRQKEGRTWGIRGATALVALLIVCASGWNVASGRGYYRESTSAGASSSMLKLAGMGISPRMPGGHLVQTPRIRVRNKPGQGVAPISPGSLKLGWFRVQQMMQATQPTRRQQQQQQQQQQHENTNNKNAYQPPPPAQLDQKQTASQPMQAVNQWDRQQQQHSFTSDTATRSSSSWVRALDLFEAMRRSGVKPDTRTYNDLMTICMRCGKLGKAKSLFLMMQEEQISPDSRSLGAMSGVYAKDSDWQSALALLSQARADNTAGSRVRPSLLLYTNVISACAKEGKWEIALSVLGTMKEDDVDPSRVTYNAAIHACTKGGAMASASGLVQELKQAGLGADVVTYTSIIAGFMWKNDIKSVIDSFRQMKQDGVRPNEHTYACVLTALTRGAEWKSALDAYKDLLDQRILAPTSVHNMAITSHVRLGEWLKAVQTYMRMRSGRIRQDVASHCLAIQAHFLGNQREAGVRFLNQVLENETDKQVIERCILTAVKACDRNQAWQQAVSLVDLSRKRYGVLTVDIVNAAIAVCARARKMEQAFSLYGLLIDNNISPKPQTFGALMTATAQAATETKGWQEALSVESEMEKNGFKLDLVTYTALITALGRGGRWEQAEQAFERMRRNSIVPNMVTYSALITAFGNGGQWEKALSTFSQCERPDVVAYSCLATAMGKSGQWQHVLDTLKNCENSLGGDKTPSLILYNSVLSALARCKRLREPLDLFNAMLEKAEADPPLLAMPNHVSYRALIEACETTNAAEQALDVYAGMQKRHVRADMGSSTTLLRLLLNNKMWGTAIKVFDSLVEEGVPMDRFWYTKMITACVKAKENYLVQVKAHNLFNDMRLKSILPGVVEYGAMIHVCAKEKNLQRAMLHFEQMQDEHIQPDVPIYTSLIKVCAHHSDWEKALDLFAEMEQIPPEYSDPPGTRAYNALITTLTNCRHRHKALKVFEKMRAAQIPPDRVTFDRLIQGYEAAGEFEMIAKMMELMDDTTDPDTQPTATTYQRAISACQQRGSWAEALQFYDDMLERELQPKENTYLALYDVCLSAKKTDLAAQFYAFMQQSTVYDSDNNQASSFETSRFQEDPYYEEEEDAYADDAYFDPEPFEVDSAFEDIDNPDV